MDKLSQRLSEWWSLCKARPWQAIAAAGAAFFFLGFLAIAPASDFTSNTEVHIARGSTLPQAADALAEAHVIAHPLVLRVVLHLFGESDHIQAGLYRFTKPENTLVVARRLVIGAYGVPLIRMTFIEGVTVREAALQVTKAFPWISSDAFRAAAGGQEGYLFPDTYFFQPSDDTVSIIKAMRSNFDKKIATLAGDIRASGHSEHDIVTMASLLEKETRTDADRRIVSGILWNRIKLGMPLQVDAVFGYINDRPTYSPSSSDLKIDSPYNTYKYRGLPPGPICNPGLDALEAAANPAKTPYLYYITGKDGLMHYAKTYPEHQANLRKYL